MTQNYMISANGTPTRFPVLQRIWNQAVDAFNRGMTSTFQVPLEDPVRLDFSAMAIAETCAIRVIVLRAVHNEHGYGLVGLRFASDDDQRLYEAWDAKHKPIVNLCIDCAHHRRTPPPGVKFVFCTRYYGAPGKEARAICKGEQFEKRVSRVVL